jgi:hypothetical protein
MLRYGWYSTFTYPHRCTGQEVVVQASARARQEYSQPYSSSAIHRLGLRCNDFQRNARMGLASDGREAL